jgi:hypothetical protein
MSITALIVGLFLIFRSRRNKKWNWAAAGVLALLLAIGMFVEGWSRWPKQTAEHFISVVSQGSYDEAKELLSEPQQLKVSDDFGAAVFAVPCWICAIIFNLEESTLPGIVTFLGILMSTIVGVFAILIVLWLGTKRLGRQKSEDPERRKAPLLPSKEMKPCRN